VGNALKRLLRERHLHEYSAFIAEYERRSRQLELPRQAAPPTKAQYYRWVGGHVQNLPRGYHCAVLERMFPGWTARDLFGPDERHNVPPVTNGGLLSSVAPALEPALLGGLWCTGYLFEGGLHHVDLSTVTTTKYAVSARNYPPEPRAERYSSGHITDITARLYGRHLVGQWRNRSDNYYYGSVHLAVLPGETILDGHYTGVWSDTEVVSGPWRWVRVDPRSAGGIDLATVTLAEPHQIYEVIAGRTQFDGPIPLQQLLSSHD
jgi:hypothetical protein